VVYLIAPALISFVMMALLVHPRKYVQWTRHSALSQRKKMMVATVVAAVINTAPGRAADSIVWMMLGKRAIGSVDLQDEV